MTAFDESFFREIVDQIQDGVYFVDKARRIIYWNRACETITGFAASQVIGKRCADNLLCHVDSDGNNLCCTRCPLHATIEDGTPRTADVFLHNDLRQLVPVRVQTAPHRDESGEIVGGIEIFRVRE